MIFPDAPHPRKNIGQDKIIFPDAPPPRSRRPHQPPATRLESSCSPYIGRESAARDPDSVRAHL